MGRLHGGLRRCGLRHHRGVIHRVHGHATHRRTDTHPALHTCLAELAQAVFLVGNFTNGGAAFNVDAAHFTERMRTCA